jgi:hypothetical protein
MLRVQVDGLNRYRFGGKAELIAAWESARNVVTEARGESEPLSERLAAVGHLLLARTGLRPLLRHSVPSPRKWNDNWSRLRLSEVTLQVV